ncbi:glucosamine--fructose-6-phosphate aminotransferase, isomerizing [Mycolicibacterium chubuense NBB4]|uniref:Glutamine--fructose-6-phosphate aminotransferase [isomerizing] n=1 Tax=Mycolicibacterium chubuense (strain NBB4) TaxID=710421 RepID=I4BPX1_MYCCN|nr:glutamine--fructose-6-phosphate transaminase (isomerizing) [Mycolicibacterium chubuense]AFM19328.1 glucosamine--fructose-6-phosphate aminotransferase, isomerizing [Mycolicibacterium chubuense NBB4]
MCGIIACRTESPAIDYLLTALGRLEYRGYDSAGVAVQTVDGTVARLRTVDRIGALRAAVTAWAGGHFGNVGVGHTRWATHGSVSVVNAHPHTDCSGQISLVHNGIIENADDLRTALTASGHEFHSSVDSEVICHLIEDQLKISADLLEAVQASLLALDGSWALAVLEECSGRIVVAARRSPLLVAHTPVGQFAASDITAIAEWVDEFRVLEDGDVVELTDSGDSADGAAPALARCVWRSNDSELSGYVDYMAKEIDEQPAAAARLIDEVAGGIANGKLWADLGLAPFERLQVLACGTSLNAGHVIGNLVRRLGGLPASFIVASEAAGEIVEPHTLCLAISQSGETADVLAAVEHRTPAESVLALTNNSHSTLARRADAYLTCAAGPEIGVAATKTFVCQVIAGAALMISALVAVDRIAAADARTFVDDLRRLPDQLDAACVIAKYEVPRVTEELSSAAGFIFMGRGSGVPYAAEGALKLKELTYRWAEHYPAGELKHGPLALIGPGTPVVVVDNAEPRLAANVAEVTARGALVIRIGPAGSTIPVVTHPVAPWGPLESVIPMQILARSLGLALGWDVDKPRNLAKSVTVE